MDAEGPVLGYPIRTLYNPIFKHEYAYPMKEAWIELLLEHLGIISVGYKTI